MDDPIFATCPRCGAPFAADDLAPLCRRCLLSETSGGKTVVPPRGPSHAARPRRKLTRFWVLVAIAAIFSAVRSSGHRRVQPPPKRSLLLERGIELHRQGKLADAIAEFRHVIQIKPDWADAHYNLGVALEEQEKPDEAVAEYRAAIRHASHHFGAHYHLGIILADQGRLDEAIAHYREASRIKSDAFELHINLGTALQAQGKLAEAIAEYRNAIWFKSDDPWTRHNLGTALFEQGKVSEAIAELRKARDHAQPGSEIAKLIASALMANGDHADPRKD